MKDEKMFFHPISTTKDLECIWSDAGVMPYKLCPHEYDCDHCALYKGMTENISLVEELNSIKNYKFSPDLLYHHNHTWVLLEHGQIVRIGLDDFAQSLLGTIQKIEIPDPHEFLNGNRIKIRARDFTITIDSPVAGDMIRKNCHLEKVPELINSYPFSAGWIAEVKLKDMKSTMHRLYSGARAIDWLKFDVERLNNHLELTRTGQDTLTDGGRPTESFYQDLSRDQIVDLFSMFLCSTFV